MLIDQPEQPFDNIAIAATRYPFAGDLHFDMQGIADENWRFVFPFLDAERGDERITRDQEPGLQAAECERDAQSAVHQPASKRRFPGILLVAMDWLPHRSAW
jgi:hypothetical protein